MTYTHLSQTERYQIQALMKAGQTQIEIARILGRHKSTISRELARGSGRRGYRPRQAQNRSEERSQGSRNAARVSPEIWCSAKAFLGLQWSPEQIASQLPISHETIYQKIYGAPCVARNKSASAMLVAMIDEGKSLIDARLLSAPNRLSDALMSVTGKAIPSLGRRTNTPSSLWLREKAATQWWPKFIERLPSKSVLPLSSDLHRSLRGPRRSLSIMVRSLRAIN